MLALTYCFADLVTLLVCVCFLVSHLHDVSTDQQRDLLRHQVGKVHQSCHINKKNHVPD